MGRPARAHDGSRRSVKLLFDQNLSIDLVAALQDLFPGITHVKSLGLASSSDRTIWRWAKANGHTICSRDGDFYHWAILETPPKFLWVRVGNCSFTDSVNLFRLNHPVIQEFLADTEQRILMLTRSHLNN